jgi:hypothetical protein
MFAEDFSYKVQGFLALAKDIAVVGLSLDSFVKDARVSRDSITPKSWYVRFQLLLLVG